MEGDAVLLMPVYEFDELGQAIPTSYKENPIIATEKSVTRAEFFNAGREGLNPQIVLVTALVNYAGEPLCAYKGVIYSIYRVYNIPDSDEIELYLEIKAGASD